MDPQVLEPRAARFSDRVMAYFLDTVPFGAGAAATVWALTGPLGKPPTADLLAAVGAAWITLTFGCQLIGNMAGGTPGKRLMGLRVAARDGSPIGFGRALARTLFWLLGQTAGHLGFIVALFNRENRALHDYVAGTVVIEDYRKTRSEGAALFVAAALAAAGLLAYQLWSGWTRPTLTDMLALGRAQDGLAVLSQVQEAHKAKTGAYASTVEQLAEASGDPHTFVTAMSAIFQPQLSIEAGNRGWRIKVRAKDRRKTLLTVSGP